MMSTSNGKIHNDLVSNLPIVMESWNSFTHSNIKGSFEYSVMPIIYSVSALAVITWFLTVFILTSYTIKPSLLLKSSTILSSIFLLIVVVRSIYDLHSQQEDGFLSGALLLEAINGPLYVGIIDFLVVILLQINQVQIIMRLFSRQSDKRLTVVVGLTASLSSQIIWAVARFYNFPKNSEAGDILPTFIYLTRTSMAICYACLMLSFLILKINYVVANKNIWLLTFLTFVVVYGPVAFFVADVANAFVNDLSEIFSVVMYVVCVVIPWEWCNKFNLIMKAKEKEGVLGRRFYEDEFYALDGLELFVEDEYNEDNDNNNDDDVAKRNARFRNKHKETKLSHFYDMTKQTFVDIADTIIATGFAIPRSASIPNSTPPVDHLTSIPMENITSETRSNEPDHSVRNRRDVFVYSTKQVAIDFSDQEDVEGNESRRDDV